MPKPALKPMQNPSMTSSATKCPTCCMANDDQIVTVDDRVVDHCVPS
jgi:hypothetical protein